MCDEPLIQGSSQPDQDVGSARPASVEEGEVSNESPPHLSSRNDTALGLLGLLETGRPSAVWAIADLLERARALEAQVPFSCEHPAWVALIRSVDVPETGEIGAELQKRIGSEAVWEEARTNWKRQLKAFERGIESEKDAFEHFRQMFTRLDAEGCRFITKSEFNERSYEDWLWDLSHQLLDASTPDQRQRSRQRAIESCTGWDDSIKESDRKLRMMKYDYYYDSHDFMEYKRFNVFRELTSGDRFTRAEYWIIRGRKLNPFNLDLHKVFIEAFDFDRAAVLKDWKRIARKPHRSKR